MTDLRGQLAISFPFTDRQAQSVVVAADAFGVEPWEMAAHVLRFREYVTTDDPGDWQRKRTR